MTNKSRTNPKRPQWGRGLFYTRDSGGQHEMTPGEYVEWTRRKSAELGLKFDGTAAQIKRMIDSRRFADGDLFLDYDMPGNVLSRPGLDALKDEVARDPNVSHVLVPRRDRFARPDEIMQGIELDAHFRKHLGVSLVFMDTTAAAIPRGQKQQVTDLIMTAVDYDAAERYRKDLAAKALNAHLALAKAGFSTGGRPSYGFRRWLVRGDGSRSGSLRTASASARPVNTSDGFPVPLKNGKPVAAFSPWLERCRRAWLPRF